LFVNESPEIRFEAFNSLNCCIKCWILTESGMEKSQGRIDLLMSIFSNSLATEKSLSVRSACYESFVYLIVFLKKFSSPHFKSLFKKFVEFSLKEKNQKNWNEALIFIGNLLDSSQVYSSLLRGCLSLEVDGKFIQDQFDFYLDLILLQIQKNPEFLNSDFVIFENLFIL
jgi:hypothetical protein